MAGEFNKGRVGRFLKLGGLTTTVGASYLGQKIKSAFVSDEARDRSLLRANVRNAERIVKTLGQLKGSVMKVGQMMSLQADVLPREMTEVLARLQKDAPPVGFDVIREQLERELEQPLEQVFETLDEQAYASASIGQVHRGRLRADGREVVVKVQYPDIHQVVESDLHNVRSLFKVAAQVHGVDNLDVIFDEVRARMTEEVDYCNERLQIDLFRELFADDDRVVIPAAVPELCTRHVLTMELVQGMDADALCAAEVSQQLRDRIGETLFDLVAIQVFEHRTLHADPNLANFAFTGDGRVILYDFGCVKRFPARFVEDYRQLLTDSLERRYERVGEGLVRIGFAGPDGRPPPLEILREYGEVLLEPWHPRQAYCFGSSDLHRRMFRLGVKHWKTFSGYSVPRHIIFLNRVVGGMYGNLRRLNATGRWGRLLRARVQPSQAAA